MKIEGTLVVHHRGFGFVDVEDHPEARSAFVAPPDLRGLLADDRVRATLERTGDDRYQAKELTLLSRSRELLFGEATREGGRLVLKIDPQVASGTWPLKGKAEPGAWVVARIDGTDAVVERVVSEQEASIERVISRHGLRTLFSAKPVAAERRLTVRGRRDLRDVVTVTIDAPHSRDLDDAVSVLAPDPSGALRMLVSIADVDALVEEGSALDLEARERATSVYLAGRILPMLPPSLSEDALSLLPGVDRPALTAELRIDPEGSVKAVDIYPSVIRSDARLDYAHVAAWLEGKEAPIAQELEPTLRRMRAVAARMTVTRAARGGVSIVAEEAHIELDEDSLEPTGWSTRPDTAAHRLIERLMVATNEAVASWMERRGLPALYRVHDEPPNDRVHMFSEAAARLGFEPALGEGLTPRSLSALEAQFEGTPRAATMYALLRRTLGPARYTVHASPHFGLGAPRYLHFTSPIRRYADLVVHRVVKGYLRGDRERHAGDESLEALALHLNDRAYRATKAEQERVHMLAARWFADRLGERHLGRVIAIKPFGLVMHLEGTGVTGTVQADALEGGPFHVSRSGDAFESKSARFTLGDQMSVEVHTVSETLGRIDLVPASSS